MHTIEVASAETAMVLIEKITPNQMFVVGTLDPIVERIKSEARAEAAKLDISIPKQREELRSLANKVTKSKTFIERQRKALVEDEKKRLKAIDAEGGRIWDELEELSKEIRKPLTDWENADKDRIAAHESALDAIAEHPSFGSTETSEEIARRLTHLEGLYVTRDWQEFAGRALANITIEIARTRKLLEIAIAREAEAAELSRLRAEAEERAQRERDEAIAKAARDKAIADAEAQAKAVAARAEAERKRIEDEKFEAEAKAKQAEERRVRDEAESKRVAKETAERVEREKIEAAAKAKRDQDAAIEAERKRVADEQARELRDAEARAKDKAHKSAINRDILSALIAVGCTDELAKAVITAIAKGFVPNTKIEY